MDNKSKIQSYSHFIQTLYIRRDPMVQQEPSYWLMKSEPI